MVDKVGSEFYDRENFKFDVLACRRVGEVEGQLELEIQVTCENFCDVI